MTNGSRDIAWRLLDVVFGLLLLVTSGSVGFAVKSGVELHKEVEVINSRLVAVEASRFTASDGLAVWKEIADVRERIARMPTEVPPAWFVERVDKIEERLGKIEGMMGGDR